MRRLIIAVVALLGIIAAMISAPATAQDDQVGGVGPGDCGDASPVWSFKPDGGKRLACFYLPDANNNCQVEGTAPTSYESTGGTITVCSYTGYVSEEGLNEEGVLDCPAGDFDGDGVCDPIPEDLSGPAEEFPVDVAAPQEQATDNSEAIPANVASDASDSVANDSSVNSDDSPKLPAVATSLPSTGSGSSIRGGDMSDLFSVGEILAAAVLVVVGGGLTYFFIWLYTQPREKLAEMGVDLDQ